MRFDEQSGANATRTATADIRTLASAAYANRGNATSARLRSPAASTNRAAASSRPSARSVPSPCYAISYQERRRCRISFFCQYSLRYLAHFRSKLGIQTHIMRINIRTTCFVRLSGLIWNCVLVERSEFCGSPASECNERGGLRRGHERLRERSDRGIEWTRRKSTAASPIALRNT